MKNINNTIFTFICDDGAKIDFEKVAPLFKQKNIKGCSAIITQYLVDDHQEFMNLDQVKELQNYYDWEILSHTHSHRNLKKLNYNEQMQEIKESKILLQNNGLRCEGLVYPYGSFNNITIDLLKENYSYGIQVGRQKIFKNYITSIGNMYKLKRVIFDNVPITTLLQKVDLVKKNNGWGIFMMHGWSMGNKELNKLIHLIEYIQESECDILTVKESISNRNH